MPQIKTAITVALDTLGCKLNQAETETLARQLTHAGYQVVSPNEIADVYIVNTCTVTHIADRKARHLLRVARRHNPEALVIAIGCYAGQNAAELAGMKEVDMVLDNVAKPGILSILNERLCPSSPTFQETTGFRTRSFIKAQDGCNNFCAYCIVPLMRGREKSLSAENIISEIKQRASEGYKEVVLTGTEIGAYSYQGTDLKRLLERVLAETAIMRLRLSSIQPQEVPTGLVGLWRDNRLCRHFHLSLQSGCDSVLRRMNRRYSTEDYKRAADTIRSNVPGVAITTDIITGFPCETEEEFTASYEFCRSMRFARIHVFPYSKRPGTKAAQMPGQVPAAVKRHRTEAMLRLAGESSERFRSRFLGKTVPVLFEKRSGGAWSGLTDNYIKVYLKSEDDLSNRLLEVKLEETRGDGVFANLSVIGKGVNGPY